jgi:NAD-dependent deacetylase
MPDVGLTRAVACLRAARSVVATTGAGISAESGVPTFRGSGGLWRNFSPSDLATPEAFARDPRLVWEWYRWRRDRIRLARPNPGHFVLARFEKNLPHFQLVTQNVDGLHQRAGSRTLIELHGNIWRSRCAAGCGRVIEASGGGGPARSGDAPGTELPTCTCGALLRPDVVWFGEALEPGNIERAMDAARSCDVLLVVGTSAVVYPAAALPRVAHSAGALVVEINVEDTPLTAEADVVLRGPAAEVLPALEALS